LRFSFFFASDSGVFIATFDKNKSTRERETPLFFSRTRALAAAATTTTNPENSLVPHLQNMAALTLAQNEYDAGVSEDDTFDFVFEHHEGLADVLDVRVHNLDDDRSLVYTFDDFRWGDGIPSGSAGHIGPFRDLEPGTNCLHEFTVWLTRHEEPRVRCTTARRRVDFSFKLVVVYGPNDEVAGQVDPSSEDGPPGLKGPADLLIDPDWSKCYRGTMSVPEGVTTDYFVNYKIV
jgi:hypothetical protein